MGGRKVLACSAIAFSVALAVVVGNRMSAEAMAVVIGVVCGVAASVPMSALILALSRRERPAAPADPAPRPAVPYFVLAAPPPARQGAPWADCGPAYSAPSVPAPREFRIIGDEPF